MRSAEDAFWRAFSGDLDAGRRALGEIQRSTQEALAWRAALGALEHNTTGSGGLLAIDHADVASAPSEEASRGLVLAWDQASRAAFVAHDAVAHARCVDAIARIGGRARALGAVLTALARARQLALDADGDALLPLTRTLESDAAAARVPAAVVEAAALRAIGELERGEIVGAVATARRAARMARTEALPPSELLATCVLARARRFAHRPHLAVHILTALARLAPDAWLPWIGWELSLSGAGEVARALPYPTDQSSPASRSSRALLDALGAIEGGDHVGLGSAIARAREAGAGALTFTRELERVAVASDACAPLDEVEPELAAWCRGDGVLPPFGLLGLAAGPDGAVAHVSASPEREARRVFASAVALGPQTIRSSRPGRVETALAVLTLGGAAGYDKSEFFRRVYGFPYRREIHQGPLEVLLHRVRRAGGGAIELERTDPRVVARTLRAFAVPDPRCAKPLDELLLKAIALRAGCTAREVSEEICIPLRTVQGALRSLTEEGACIAERRGRHVVYVVEDTTFSEPTRRHRRRELARAGMT